MTTSFFTYEKPKVIQALRYHFVTRKEIRILIVVVNIFAIASAALFFFKKIQPTAFMVGSLLWFVLMISFWFILPYSIYKRSKTFLDRFRATLGDRFTLESERGAKSWEWEAFSSYIESPHFFHLYFTPTSFFLVPKTAFEGDQLTEAREILKRNIIKENRK